MKKIVVVSLLILWSFTAVMSQCLEPFGLQGMNITSLAISPAIRSTTWHYHLFAGTDSHGVFVRDLTADSGWITLGLRNKKVTSLFVYYHGNPKRKLNTLFAGVERNKSADDSTLLYKYSVEGDWIPFDKGLNRLEVENITAIIGFYSFRSEQCGPLFAAGGGFIWRLDEKWKEILAPEVLIHTLQVNQNYWMNGEVWAGGETKLSMPWIAKSPNHGKTWEINSPTVGENNAVLSFAINPHYERIVYAGIRGGVIKTTNGGKTWDYTALHDLNVSFTALGIDHDNPEHIYAGGVRNQFYFAFYETFNGGQNWHEIPELGKDLPHKGISDLVVDPKRGDIVYIATMDNGVWRYQSKERLIRPDPLGFYPMAIGNKWEYESLRESYPHPRQDTLRSTTTVISDTILLGRKYWVVQYKNNYNFLYYVRIDTPTYKVYSLSLRDSSEYTIYALNAKIGEVTDSIGFEERCGYFDEKSLFGEKVLIKGFVSEVIYGFEIRKLAWGFGPCYSDYTGHGEDSFTYLIGARINGLNYGSLTSVDDCPNLDIPNSFTLYPNYPNPFNATTTIRYDLHYSSFVRLEIYNILGQKVRTLVNDCKQAGSYRVQWDGVDDAGKMTTSGVYIYHINAGEWAEVHKLILLR